MADVTSFLQWPAIGNFYEVGGGKTVVSTVVSLMGGNDLTLVVAPPILITPWVRWLNKVSERVVDYRGTPAARKKIDISGARWVVTTPGMLRLDYPRLYAEVYSRSSAQLIVDEAHGLKNVASKFFLGVEELVFSSSIYRTTRSGSRVKIPNFPKEFHVTLQKLTGTPISKPLDAYAYIALKTPDIYRGLSQVESLYVADRDYFGAITKYKNLDKLAADFSLHTITRTKEEIHGYNNPPLYPEASYSLSAAHYKLYEKLVEEQLLQFDDGQKIDVSTANKLYHALQQVVVNFDYFSNNPEAKSESLELIDMTIEQTQCLLTEKSKLIIWTNYKMSSARVLRYLVEKGIKAVAAYSGANSEKSVEAFMSDPECRILVAQYQSAGMGLNPQGVCWESLFLELTTVPIYMRQALGRIDRYGQKHLPTQRLAFAVGTVQESIMAKLLVNDANAVEVEVTKTALRAMLFGKPA